MSPEVRFTEEERLRLLRLKIEVLVAEAGAEIRAGDAWCPIYLYIGSSEERLV